MIDVYPFIYPVPPFVYGVLGATSIEYLLIRHCKIRVQKVLGTGCDYAVGLRTLLFGQRPRNQGMASLVLGWNRFPQIDGRCV
jgi:hypothetical protein